MISRIFARRSAGIELRDSSITLLILERRIDGIRLVASETFPFLLAGNNDDSLFAIKLSLIQHRVSPKDVGVCIPKSWTVTRFIDVPAPDQELLQNIMPFELERHMPFHPSEVYHNFGIAASTGNAYRVVFSAIKKDLLDIVIQFLKTCGIAPHTIVADSFARIVGLRHAVINQRPSVSAMSAKLNLRKNSVYLLITAESGSAEAALIYGRSCLHIETLSFGSTIPFDSLFRDMMTRINPLLKTYSIPPVNMVIISGSLNAGIVAKIAEAYNLKTVLLADCIRIKSSESHESFLNGLSSFGAAVSISSAESMLVNLAPAGKKSSTKNQAIIFKTLAALCVLLVSALAASVILKERSYFDSIESSIKKNRSGVAVVEKLSSRIMRLEADRDFLLSGKQPISMLNIIADLTALIPSDTWVTSLSFQEAKKSEAGRIGELSISGFSGSASKLIAILENSSFLKNASFEGSVTKSPNGEGFKIRAAVVTAKAQRIK
ncbi:MAG: PilN domain-containing protein [Dissulfurispiraceae bacterium]|nr:PilN domain-containing protein [Dissulfurispiraceae bacterium]